MAPHHLLVPTTEWYNRVMSANMDMDMEMSGDGPTDYSDFEYQQIRCQNVIPDSASDGTNVLGKVDIDVLEEQGGLSTNEVAELVYIETETYIEQETDSGLLGSTSESMCEVRGVVGSDIGEPDLFQSSGEDQQGDIIAGTASGGTQAAYQTQSVSSAFHGFAATAGTAFTNDTVGAGGSFSGTPVNKSKNFRDLTNRGPVLGANDNITVIHQFTSSSVNNQVRSNVRIHLVWDISTVDDASEQFSVPS